MKHTSPRNSPRRRNCIWCFILLFLCLAPVAGGGQTTSPGAGSVRTIRVVMGNNYPPYIFVDKKGGVQGILADRWRLWQEKTGIRVQLVALDWKDALVGMKAGRFDVIDAAFVTEERQGWLEFGKPYVNIEAAAFFCKNIGVYKAVDFLVVFENETILKNIKPDFSILKKIKEEAKMPDDCFGIITTAKGDNCDFVSRFFAPNAGIDEDPVTGRAHCTLIPYWAEKLGKNKMKAFQLSKRTGELDCEYLDERVLIGGKAVLYSKGNININ